MARRTLLAQTSTAIAVTAGCSRVGLLGMDSPADFEITNDADQPYLVTVTLTGSEIDGENKQEQAVLAGETVVFEGIVPQTDSEYRFRAEFQLDREVVRNERYVMKSGRDTFRFRITADGTIEEEFDPDDQGG